MSAINFETVDIEFTGGARALMWDVKCASIQLRGALRRKGLGNGELVVFFRNNILVIRHNAHGGLSVMTVQEAYGTTHISLSATLV